jgi:hypothetical protein
MTSGTPDLFAAIAGTPAPTAPTARPRWLLAAFRDSLEGHAKVAASIKADQPLFDRVLDAIEWMIDRRLDAYRRATRGDIDSVAASFGWVQREDAITRQAAELLRQSRIELVNLPFDPKHTIIHPSAEAKA